MDRDIALKCVTHLNNIKSALTIIDNNATPSVPAPDSRSLDVMRARAAEDLQDPEPEPEPETRKKSTNN